MCPMRGNHAKCAEYDKDEDFFSNSENHAKCVKIMQNNVPRTPGTIIFQLKITQNAIHSLQCLNHAKCATRGQIMQSSTYPWNHYFPAQNHTKCNTFLAVVKSCKMYHTGANHAKYVA